MATPTDIAAAVAQAPTWDGRVSLIRQVPQDFGRAQRDQVYAAVATEAYVPSLAPDFAYIHWREDYELPGVELAYRIAHDATQGFTDISQDKLSDLLRQRSTTLRIFRLLVGYTAQELAAASKLIAERDGTAKISTSRVKSAESGSSQLTTPQATTAARVVDEAIKGVLFPAPAGSTRSKQDKPDTVDGWETVARYARDGVPLPTFLHQRYYGGAFRQLLDATSRQRGDLLEDPVERLFDEYTVPFIRTGSHNQAEIEQRFSLRVRPAPDFVIYDETDSLRAILECKGANDGGTARDKASRFRTLRDEAARLGGIPVLAVIGGLGWTRVMDALGPVVRDTDGRVFTLKTLPQMLTVAPFPQLSSTSTI